MFCVAQFDASIGNLPLTFSADVSFVCRLNLLAVVMFNRWSTDCRFDHVLYHLVPFQRPQTLGFDVLLVKLGHSRSQTVQFILKFTDLLRELLRLRVQFTAEFVWRYERQNFCMFLADIERELTNANCTVLFFYFCAHC